MFSALITNLTDAPLEINVGLAAGTLPPTKAIRISLPTAPDVIGALETLQELTKHLFQRMSLQRKLASRVFGTEWGYVIVTDDEPAIDVHLVDPTPLISQHVGLENEV